MDTMTKMITDETTAIDKLTNETQKMVSFGQGNIEAIMQSSQIWLAGCQAISRTMAANAQTQFDRNMSNWKALLGTKSLQEGTELRTALMQESCKTFFAETGEITDAAMKLTEEAIAPIAARLTLAVEKATHRPH